ncbi:uncharacterized protein V6R79_017270 [Siganus canaliculatus]
MNKKGEQKAPKPLPNNDTNISARLHDIDKKRQQKTRAERAQLQTFYLAKVKAVEQKKHINYEQRQQPSGFIIDKTKGKLNKPSQVTLPPINQKDPKSVPSRNGISSKFDKPSQVTLPPITKLKSVVMHLSFTGIGSPVYSVTLIFSGLIFAFTTEQRGAKTDQQSTKGSTTIGAARDPERILQHFKYSFRICCTPDNNQDRLYNGIPK